MGMFSIFSILYNICNLLFGNKLNTFNVIKCEEADLHINEKEYKELIENFLKEITKDREAEIFHRNACKIMKEKVIFSGKPVKIGEEEVKIEKKSTFIDQIKEFYKIIKNLDKELTSKFTDFMDFYSLNDRIKKLLSKELPLSIKKELQNIPSAKECKNKDKGIHSQFAVICKICQEFETVETIRQIKTYRDFLLNSNELEKRFVENSSVYRSMQKMMMIDDLAIPLENTFKSLVCKSKTNDFIQACWMFYLMNSPLITSFIKEKIGQCPRCKSLLKDSNDLHEKIGKSLNCSKGKCFINNDYKMALFYITEALNLALNHNVYVKKLRNYRN